jgi:hypothetical protein
MNKQDLIVQCAIKVLHEHAAGRSVDPDRLDWAVRLALFNPQRMTAPVKAPSEVVA